MFSQRLLTLVLTVCLTWLHPISWAQDSLNVVLTGEVVCLDNDQVLPDAHIHVKGTSIATQTNEDGRFSLKLTQLPDTIEISAIGFRNTLMTRQQIIAASKQGKKGRNTQTAEGKQNYDLRIELKSTATLLHDVFVYSPQNILDAALDRIEKNYPQTPRTYEAFYRETIRKRSNYVSVSEAVMELYKTSYRHSSNRDMVHIRKGRSLMSQKARDTISVHVQGGPVESLNLDFVKNRELFLNPEVLRFYNLEIEVPQMINNRPQYVIAFSPRVELNDEPLFSGLMYIDFATLAFTRIEYNMDMSDQAKATRVMLARKPLGMRFRPRALMVVVNYHDNGQQTLLSYMRVTYRFDCDWKRRGLATRYEAVSEMLVTDSHPTEERPERRDAFRYTDVLSKKLSDFADPDFWRDYNILLPSESLEHALRRIKKSFAK